MSKEIEWGMEYGEGEIVCVCDNCENSAESFGFEDNSPDYRYAQRQLNEMGWVSCKINGDWYDFCCEECRNEFIKHNT